MSHGWVHPHDQGLLMLDITKLLQTQLGNSLAAHYSTQYGHKDPEYLQIILDAANLAMRHISHCDALYHNMEHTIYVTIAGQAIMAGKRLEDPIDNKDWANVTLALLFHDIGFARGCCQQDTDAAFYNGERDGKMVMLARENTDASLMPYHVNRGQRFVEEQFGGHEWLDIELIQACIERTRFPVPDDEAYAPIDDLPGLVRAADLIGQFSDPRYLYKLNALFQEFEEQGLNKIIGYHTPQDMRDNYPEFYHSKVEPYISKGLYYLRRTLPGQEILKSMETNLHRASQSRQFPTKASV